MRITEMKRGGLFVGMTDDKSSCFINTGDNHTYTLGATRSGKSRTIVLPSIVSTALAGESMVVIDPKGELYAYTRPCLERLGYECLALDFLSPELSVNYNFLQPVIDKINSGKTDEAISATEDIVSILIPQGTSKEPVWEDGASCITAMAILAVVYENKDQPEYQNLANAYAFITNMCEMIGTHGRLPLNEYIKGLDETHPVKLAAALSKVAPSKMRASFYTQALTTLRLFKTPSLHSMTASTSFDVYRTGDKKRVIFLILPDEKSTYYPIASLFVAQHYQMLTDYARAHGNRLNRRVHFFCDEFGNFAKLKDIMGMVTVGAGRGMIFHFFLQDNNLLYAKYEQEGKTIRANCDTMVYLKCNEYNTRKEVSDDLGAYTVKAPGVSGSTRDTSASYNFTGRPLLHPDELEKIKRPYELIIHDGKKILSFSPDISQIVFNKMLGMGDEAHNIFLQIDRQKQRPKHKIEYSYWGIWEKYRQAILAKDSKANDLVNIAKGSFNNLQQQKGEYYE